MRPKFLDQPLSWTRTQRTARDPVREAYAGERCVNTRMHPADRIVLRGCVVALLALAAIMVVTQ